MALGDRSDVEEGKRLLRFEELEGGDLSWKDRLVTASHVNWRRGLPLIILQKMQDIVVLNVDLLYCDVCWLLRVVVRADSGVESAMWGSSRRLVWEPKVYTYRMQHGSVSIP